ncbi:betaine/proline/choline family ABC transporter ATP-binding protein [Bacillus lacus]|uniref:Quaternary amine transport ATP-binding protein n=1 Tax=Metabacillus lacus TaxID=1983721 RepID=A0A7X2LYC0_9BACI|nr:betaine/proline/choline family ABC transporter ATP-binding protein [Metabacillus lacus]
MSHKKIEVRNVSKIFGKHERDGLSLIKEGQSKSEILKKTGLAVGVSDVSFSVREGEIFVIMGLSGSGKSTLVRLLNLLIKPTAGDIAVDGENLINMKAESLLNVRRKKMSMVFQSFALFPHKNLAENAAFGLDVQGIGKKERIEKAVNALRLVGLEEYAKSYPHQLSGGMKQRVGLARALANNPDVLLMDEAFSALDPLIRKDMQDELLSLQAKMKKTIVFITHDLDEALRIGDRIALMKDGAIVQIGTPEEIMTNPANDYVEKFVEDVNLGKVITAKSIAEVTHTIVADCEPKEALRMINEAHRSYMIAVDKQQLYKGVLTYENARKAVFEDKPILHHLIHTHAVSEETVLEDLYKDIAHAVYPLPVVSTSGQFKGVIKKDSVLQALAGTGGRNHD